MTEKGKKYIKNALKLGVSVAALSFVFSKVDVGQTWGIIRQAQLKWLLVALAAYVLSQVVSSERVRGMLNAVPVILSRSVNMRLYWLGMLYNFFLPGGIGGDGYKVYWLHRRFGVKVKPVVFALLGDRISGLTAILAYTVFYVAMREGLAEMITGIHFDSLWLLALIPLGLLIYWTVFRVVQRNLASASLTAFARSLIVQGLQMVAAAFILMALDNEECDVLGDYLFLFLLSSIASAIPATLAGVGAREMAFIIGSEYLIVQQDVAVALSLMFYTVSLISSLPGVVYAFRTDLIDGRAVPEPDMTPTIADAMEEISQEQTQEETLEQNQESAQSTSNN